MTFYEQHITLFVSYNMCGCIIYELVMSQMY